jgi:hypothetical protein
MDDLRNHDPKPNAHEREWIETDPRAAISRVFICAAIALMIGTASSALLNPHAPAVKTAATSR